MPVAMVTGMVAMVTGSECWYLPAARAQVIGRKIRVSSDRAQTRDRAPCIQRAWHEFWDSQALLHWGGIGTEKRGLCGFFSEFIAFLTLRLVCRGVIINGTLLELLLDGVIVSFCLTWAI